MKVHSYLIILVCIMVVLNFLGFQTASVSVFKNLGDIITNPEGFKFLDFFTTIEGILTGIAISTTILAGVLFRSSPESYLLVPYSIGLMAITADFAWLITESKKYCVAGTICWQSAFVILIMGPLLIGFAHSIISWWGNRSG